MKINELVKNEYNQRNQISPSDISNDHILI